MFTCLGSAFQAALRKQFEESQARASQMLWARMSPMSPGKPHRSDKRNMSLSPVMHTNSPITP